MTSLDDLLNVLDEAEKEAGSSGGYKTIAMAEIKLGYAVFTSPPQYFLYELNDKASKDQAIVEAQELANSSGVKFNERSNHGIATTVFGGDKRLTHPETTRIEFDITRFTPAWQGETAKLTDAEVELRGTAKMPYTAIRAGIQEANALALFDGPQWCMLREEIDGYQQAKGRKQVDKNDETKTYPWRIYVVEKVYANEAEAKAEAGQLKSGQASSNGKLSPLAVENGWTESSLLEMADTINEQLANATKGVAVDGSKLTGMNPVKAKQYIAGNYSVTVDDLALVIPF